jgi:hypothetical protein
MNNCHTLHRYPLTELRSGFEECAYTLFVLVHAAAPSSRPDPLFDADLRNFKRRKDDYNAALAALGQPCARPWQKLRLPCQGKIVVTFSVEDMMAKAGNGSKWDLLLVGWEMELEHDVLLSLRASTRCLVPALAHQQFAATAQPSSASSITRQKARSRGFFDFCENKEMVYANMQSCFAVEE